MLIFLAVLAFVWGYKKAKRTGRRPGLWSLICGFTFLGAQILVSIACASVIAIGITFFGWHEDLFEKLYYPVGVLGLVAGIISLLIVFSYLDKAPKVPVFSMPPAPPQFDGSDDL